MRRALPLLLVLAAACTASESTDASSDDLGTTKEAIVNGTDSTDAQNSVVLLLHYDALASGGGAAEGCSGTLLADNLVLTARHCVSDTDEEVVCDSNGNALQGGKIISNYDPTKIYVFGGKNRPDFTSKNLEYSTGTEVLTPDSGVICNNDLALIVLNKPVANGIPAPIRLTGGAQKGEAVTAVGWGIATTTEDPAIRQQRAISIIEVGPSTNDQLASSEFLTGEGGCSGDSGGPVFSASGAVIGALSRGGNGSSSAQGAAGCTGANAENIYTAAAQHADFIYEGYQHANATPWLEGQSSPGVGGDAGPTEVTVVTHHGCNSSGSGSFPFEIPFTVAVLFVCRRRRNPAISRI